MSSLPSLPVSGDVHVWHVSLDEVASEVIRLQPLLSPEERMRADRLREDRDRLRYVVAHGRLREILSGCTGIAARDLHFGRNRHGKPHLAEGTRRGDLRFSLSHSGDRALVAVTVGQPVGVDIERIVPDTDVLAIAERFFAMDELRLLRALPLARRLEGFFQLWTCKEAYVKARGEGIIDRLSSFTVSVDSAGQATLVEDTRGPVAPAHWHLELLRCAPSFAAAVVSTNVHRGTVLHDWPDAPEK